jgi:uncharacterized RmlC-like cupin family protein
MIAPGLRTSGGAALVLAPVTLADFFATSYETQPLHVRRADPGYFAAAYGVGEVESSLVVAGADFAHVALVCAGKSELTAEQFGIETPAVRSRQTGKPPQRRIDPRAVATFFEAGYTLILKDAALFSARLARLCDEVMRDLGCYLQANVYLTPPGAQGFAVHHDTHDTLTIQIEGEKTWRIYEPVVELPIESQPFPSGMQVPGLRLNREVTLAAGDTLYLPRGYPHEAISASTGRSLHVTFALTPIRALDVLDVLFRLAGDAEVGLRRALTPAMLDDPQFAEKFAADVVPHLLAALTPERIRFAKEYAINEQFRLVRGQAAGQFDTLAGLAGIGDETTLRVNPAVPAQVRDRGATVDLLIAGKSLGFPKICAPAFARLAEGPVTFGELGLFLTAPNRAVFVKNLVLEGYLLIGDEPG